MHGIIVTIRQMNRTNVFIIGISETSMLFFRSECNLESEHFSKETTNFDYENDCVTLLPYSVHVWYDFQSFSFCDVIFVFSLHFFHDGMLVCWVNGK